MAVNICRACLIEKQFSELYDWFLSVDIMNESLTYQKCFTICTQLDVEKADATSSYYENMHFLCSDCVQELRISYHFLRKAQKSAEELYFLSQKHDNVNVAETNEFEYVNIQESRKSDFSADLSPNAKHIARESITKTGKVSLTLIDECKSENCKQSDPDDSLLGSPILQPKDIPPKGSTDSIKKCIKSVDNLKLESEPTLNPFDCKTDFKLETVQDVHDETFAKEHICLQEKETSEETIYLVDCNAHLLKNENSKSNSKRNTTERKKMKAKNISIEYMQTPCEYCKKLFPENKLREHKSRYHRPKIFLCDICPSSFSIANNLRRHQRTHDLNRERNFSCSECGRKFFTEDVYKTHIKIHLSTRQAKFRCTQCDKVFMHKGSLTLHLQKHTGPKNECSVCMKRYVRKVDLEVHMRNHSGDLPYQCSKCEKAFMTTSALRKHELLHNGIRYKCDICNKEYSHPSKLSRHRLDHTGLPLKCAMCDKGFAEPNKIRRHIKSVHKVEDISQINKLTIKVSKNDE
ncbi:zinc finger protein ZFP2-like [Anastrepha obliqua]|uniref:zinc finger protein ZFP2-like n=1 Tax=Anastrepha obliqua TaxID=95512 RepID=UPI00240A3602|nr:zinc finger protein ZFP2-like [Anastrepha obliqua]